MQEPLDRVELHANDERRVPGDLDRFDQGAQDIDDGIHSDGRLVLVDQNSDLLR